MKQKLHLILTFSCDSFSVLDSLPRAALAYTSLVSQSDSFVVLSSCPCALITHPFLASRAFALKEFDPKRALNILTSLVRILYRLLVE